MRGGESSGNGTFQVHIVVREGEARVATILTATRETIRGAHGRQSDFDVRGCGQPNALCEVEERYGNIKQKFSINGMAKVGNSLTLAPIRPSPGDTEMMAGNDPPIGRNILELVNIQQSENYTCLAASTLGTIEATTFVRVQGT